MDVARSQIQRKIVHTRESTSNPDVLKEIKGIGSGFMV